MPREATTEITVLDGAPRTAYQIVVGVDGSENGQRALAWAVAEAQLRGGEVTALFAWETPLVGMPGAFDREQLEAEAKGLLTAEVEAAGAPDQIELHAVVAQGDATASLLAACERLDADLLVLGSRGREGFSGLLLGSVGQQCAAYAPCPVVIVKPRQH